MLCFFVNGAAMLETALDPEAVLAALHGAEAALGRVRPARWAPRICDLDLIAIEDIVLPDRATLERWMAIDLGQAQTVAPASKRASITTRAGASRMSSVLGLKARPQTAKRRPEMSP